MKKIEELAQLFAEYKIYPKSCYNNYSPVRAFQGMFPENYYSKDLETFLSYQNYRPAQKGVDLPWWGKEFFTAKAGFRILIVSQDSLAKEAGSIVLWGHLMPVINSEVEYKKYSEQLNTRKLFYFCSWSKIKSQLVEWGINFNFLYITDASKVYKEGAWKDRVNREKSKKLLEAEIEFCEPGLIILLGRIPLCLLDKTKIYGEVVESRKNIFIKGVKSVVSPFFIGNGPLGNRYGLGFKKRLEIASDLIKKLLKKK
jgi:hypothetical protein